MIAAGTHDAADAGRSRVLQKLWPPAGGQGVVHDSPGLVERRRQALPSKAAPVRTRPGHHEQNVQQAPPGARRSGASPRAVDPLPSRCRGRARGRLTEVAMMRSASAASAEIGDWLAAARDFAVLGMRFGQYLVGRRIDSAVAALRTGSGHVTGTRRGLLRAAHVDCFR